MTDAMEAALDRFANIDPPYPRWLGGDNADKDFFYCGECAEKAVAEGRAEFVDGGWGSEEEDTCCHCETCGRVLDYTLTEHGVAYELAHFRENPPTAPLDPEVAYHIARMIESAPDDPEVVKIAMAAVACIQEERGNV